MSDFESVDIDILLFDQRKNVFNYPIYRVFMGVGYSFITLLGFWIINKNLELLDCDKKREKERGVAEELFATGSWNTYNEK